jgi:hypothetical protein
MTNDNPPIPPESTVSTGGTGTLAICDCRSQHPEDELVAHIFPGDNEVIVHRDGRVANHYRDGTAGVDKSDKEAASDITNLFCPKCKQSVHGWLSTDEPQPRSRDGPRKDMLAHMEQAKEAGRLRIPRHDERYLPPEVAEVILGEKDSSTIEYTEVYALTLEGDHTHIAYRIDNTHLAMHFMVRGNGSTHHAIGPWGEACLFLRYATVMAEISDKQLTIKDVSRPVIDSILKSSPEAWHEDLVSLLKDYSSDQADISPNL